MKFDVLTIFPEAVRPYLETSILGRAQKDSLLHLAAHDLREWTQDKHKSVDDTPYGGGAGMVLKVEPFDLALKDLRGEGKVRVILTSASGKMFTQQDARRLSEYDQIIFLCGRYEGVDHRVQEHLADEALSIGNYVLTGGELPALVMADAVARLVPGVIDVESLARESHDEAGYTEHPQYTKPETYGTWSVPPILLSGDHAKIEQWRQEQSAEKSHE